MAAKVLIVLACVAAAVNAGGIVAPLAVAPFASSYTAHTANHAIATPIVAPVVARYASPYVAPAVAAPLIAPVAKVAAPYVSVPAARYVAAGVHPSFGGLAGVAPLLPVAPAFVAGRK